MQVRLKLIDRKIGDVDSPYPLVVLRVRDRYGTWAPVHFRIDTGSDCAAIPVPFARQEGIPFQQTRVSMAAGLVGTTPKFRDRLQVMLGGREHDWPCDFIDATPPEHAQRGDPLREVAVLGRAGFLDEYALAIDDGYLIITRLGPVRRMLRRGLQWLWAITGQVHPAEEPL
jgi:hypothetical protein